MSDRPPEPPPSVKRVQYRGEPLDAARGPGLGCFRIQLVVLVAAIILTPLSVAWGWPAGVSAALLFAVIVLLFVSGQTIIFLLRLVAADRREGRRRPLASATKTVGELADEGEDGSGGEAGRGGATGAPAAPAEDDKPGVRE